MIGKLCIFGVGLIGGSLARALKEKHAVEQVVGCSRRTEHLQSALELGVVDHYTTDPIEAVKGADVVVLAVPMDSMVAVLEKLKPGLSPNTILTDVGSAKRGVVEAVQQVFGELPPNFIPGHPIAGNEKSGVEASFSHLFNNRKIILTPTEKTRPQAVEKVREMWLSTGAQVIEMEVDHHDEVLAATSHLPHVLAYSLVDTLNRMSDRREIFQYAAGGFRDFTRIASSDPTMWRDICLHNKDAILQVLDRFTNDLQTVRTLIENSDRQGLFDVFEEAKDVRDQFVKMLEG